MGNDRLGLFTLLLTGVAKFIAEITLSDIATLISCFAGLSASFYYIVKSMLAIRNNTQDD